MKNLLALCLAIAFLGIGILAQENQPTLEEQRGLYANLNEQYHYCVAIFSWYGYHDDHYDFSVFCDGKRINPQNSSILTKGENPEQVKTSVIGMLVRESKMKLLTCHGPREVPFLMLVKT